jgi:hypothetical protein
MALKNFFGEFGAGSPAVGTGIDQLLSRSRGLMSADWFNNSQQPQQGDPNTPTPNQQMDPQGNPQGGNGVDYDGFASNVPRSLIGSESSGRWDAQNNATGSSGRNGHYGILQFGHDRLDEAKAAGVVPKDMTPEQFMASKEYQVSAANWHFADIDNKIYKNGYDKMLGMDMGGRPLTMDGMRAIAHLGGFGGLSRFLNSGGKYNPADAFGTSLASYGNQHSRVRN